MHHSLPEILCVDDDPAVRKLLAHQLASVANIVTVSSGEEAMATLARHAPFAVVLSDMHLPGMTGIDLLRRVVLRTPITVRMMVTGDEDRQVAIDAVNEGCIFRFLAKPIRREELLRIVEAGLEQHRLLTAERELLEETLHDSIWALTSVLSLVNPLAFGRASRLKRYVAHMATRLGLKDGWKYEVAAMLSQLGYVTLRADTLDKVYAGLPLSPEESRAVSELPSIACGLLGSIPRLWPIARMIEGPQSGAVGAGTRRDPEVDLGSRLLQAALGLDERLMRGERLYEAIRSMKSTPEGFDTAMLVALENLPPADEAVEVRNVSLAGLRLAMILDGDVRSQDGLLLVARGQEVTRAVLERLRNFAAVAGVNEPFRVLVPLGEARRREAA